ncbi:MAG: hypothetical protein ACI90V_011586 [Bacillariaceae sp.]
MIDLSLFLIDARIAVKNVCNLHRRQEGLFEPEFPHGNNKKASKNISRVEWLTDKLQLQQKNKKTYLA